MRLHPWRFLWREAPLWVSAVTALVAGFGLSAWIEGLDNPLIMLLVFVVLFGIIIASAMRVVHHGERLAELLGEPYGTLILTLSVVTIEVMMISAVMLGGDPNPAMARDTLFSSLMIALNAILGLGLLLGGLRHHEQSYNLQGANAYLSVIIPLAVFTMVLPDVTSSSPAQMLSGFQSTFLILVALLLYGVFLIIQTGRHSSFFSHALPVLDNPKDDEVSEAAATAPDSAKPHVASGASGAVPQILLHAGLLIAYLIPIVFLAEDLAEPIDFGIEEFGAPAALGGLMIAILVMTPESVTAVRAALANQLQRSVNILLGSVLASISLTVPAVIIIGMLTEQPLRLGLDSAGTLLLGLTLLLLVITFSVPRTNMLQGAVHLVLFLAYLMLIFAP